MGWCWRREIEGALLSRRRLICYLSSCLMVFQCGGGIPREAALFRVWGRCGVLPVPGRMPRTAPSSRLWGAEDINRNIVEDGRNPRREVGAWAYWWYGTYIVYIVPGQWSRSGRLSECCPLLVHYPLPDWSAQSHIPGILLSASKMRTPILEP